MARGGHDDQRYGLIAIRVNRDERKRLKELQAQRDTKNLSDTVRFMLGFPHAGDVGGIPGADDIEDVDRLCGLVVNLIEKVNVGNQMLTQLCRKEGIRNAMADILERPLAATVLPRGGTRHPDLPEGFSR
jgi:hypothetical protein